MATGELRARLSEMFTCMICYDDFRMKTPRMLSCLHVFCEDCIQHLLGRGQDTDDFTVSCPMCMAKTAVPSGQAANLPLFFHMRKIGDMTKEMEQCHLVCTMCKTSTNTSAVSAFCVQCAIGLCEKCHVRHNTALESHSAISVTPSTMNQLICHKYEKCVQYYCLSCQRSICCVCYLVEHREHKPVFELAYEGHVPNCDVKQCLDDRLQLADQSMQDLDHIQKDVDVITNDSRKELKRRRDSLIRQIDEQYNRFCKQVDRTHQTITEDIQEARSQVQLDKEWIKGQKEKSKRWLEPVPGVPGVKIRKLHSLESYVKKRLPSVNSPIDKVALKVFMPTTEDVQLGQLTRQNISVRWIHTDLHCARTICTGVECVLGMCFLNSGQLVIIGDSGLHVYEENGKKTKHHLSSIHRSDTDLCGVCTDRNENMIVITQNKGQTLPGYLHVHTLEGGIWEHQRLSICCMPWRVALGSSKHFIVSDYNANLYKYDKYGDSTWQVKMSDSGQSLCVDDDERIIVCLSEDVVVYDNDGCRLLSFQLQNTSLEPRCVCADKQNIVLVADRKTNSISLYTSEDGVYIKTVLSLPWKVEQVTLKTMKYLALSNWKDIFLYRIQYRTCQQCIKY